MSKAVLKDIDLDCLTPGQFQPRQYFDQDALQELADSICSQGLIEPLVVRPLGTDQFEIIAGERRWRAAQLARLHSLPCLVRHYSDQQAAAVGLIENVQREDLNPIEEANAYLRLVDEFQFYHEEVAKIVGKSRAHVTNCLRLLELDAKVKTALIEQRISIGHAKVLVGLDRQDQCNLLDNIINQQWSVRRVESQVKKLKAKGEFANPKRDKDVARLEQIISEQCGAQTQIETHHEDGGWLKFKFYNNDTLAGLLDRMGIKYED